MCYKYSSQGALSYRSAAPPGNSLAGARWGLLVQTLNDIQAQEYSDNLSMNIRRGNAYAAENCFYLGREIFGYKGAAGQKYEIDPQTAPFVTRLFREYAGGKRLQMICHEMNSAGLRTVRGNPFRVETLRKMLKNEAYLGVYQFGDVRVEGGMPALVDQATFDAVQEMFAKNRYRTGRYPLEEREDKETRYWLSEKLICGECGGPMQGLSGTSKTGRKYTYYACKNMRAKGCSARAVRQLELEDIVTEALRHILSNTENLASLAVDMSAALSKQADTGAVESLKASLVEVTRRLDNVVKVVVEHGIVSSTLQDQLTSLETQKDELAKAIEVEEIKQSIAQKDTSILAFFNEWVRADFDDPGVRETLLDYFVDSMTWKDGRLRVFGNYYESPPDSLFNPLDVEVDGESINFPDAENALKGFESCVLGSTNKTAW